MAGWTGGLGRGWGWSGKEDDIGGERQKERGRIDAWRGAQGCFEK